MHFVEQKYKLQQERNRKWKIPHSFRETILVPQPMEESQIKSKTVLSWSLRKKKRHFLYRLFCPKAIFLRFVFYLNLHRIYILLLNKKYYFIHFSCLFIKFTYVFSVSLSHFNLTWSLSTNRCNSTTFFSDLRCFYRFLFYHA